MKKIFLMASLMILSSTCVLAGVMNLTCKNKTGTILMNVSAVGAIGQIEIHHNRAGKKEIYKGEVFIMSGYDDKCRFSEKIICAIPIGDSKSTSEDCKQMHVVRDDGFDCLGQKMWRIENQQSYVLTTASGKLLSTDKKHGYIQDSFTCTNEGFTSPRGCFVDRDFRLIEWLKIDCDDFK